MTILKKLKNLPKQRNRIVLLSILGALFLVYFGSGCEKAKSDREDASFETTENLIKSVETVPSFSSTKPPKKKKMSLFKRLKPVKEKKWFPPKGSPETLAKTMSVKSLIDSWNHFPPKSDQNSQHALFAKALGEMGPKARDAIPHLAAHIAHEDAYIRSAALEALAGIGPIAIPEIVKGLKIESPSFEEAIDVRFDTVMALSLMGEGAEEAMDSILELIRVPEENDNVRASAAGVLLNIGEPAVLVMEKAREFFLGLETLTLNEEAVLEELTQSLLQFGVIEENPAVPFGIEPSKTEGFLEKSNAENNAENNENMGEEKGEEVLEFEVLEEEPLEEVSEWDGQANSEEQSLEIEEENTVLSFEKLTLTENSDYALLD